MRNLLPRASAFCSSLSLQHAVLIFAVALLVFAAFPTSLYSQTANTGGVTGVVTDSSGAAIADASITLTDRATNTQRTTTSNDAGRYTFANVPPGSYDLTVNKSGFRTTKTRQQSR